MTTELDALNRLWGTRQAKKVHTPKEFPLAADIWNWALEIAERDENLIGTAMRSTFQNESEDEEGMIYASRGNASEKVRKALIKGVRNRSAVQLQVNWLDKKAPEYGTFLRNYLDPVLREHYPFGWDMSAVMFITGSAHVYDAHCDLEDGLLFQLHGRKKVRCWGPSPEWYQQPIFDLDHFDKPHLFQGREQEFDLTPGHVLYFSAGVMHEVSIPEGEISVSISVRPSTVYPIISVAGDLNRMVGEKEGYLLPEEKSHWFKFKANFFEPSRYADSLKTEQGRTAMPKELKQAFLGIVKSGRPELEKKLPQLLDAWWADFAKRRNHCPTGALPPPPPDREIFLAKLERQRRERKGN